MYQDYAFDDRNIIGRFEDFYNDFEYLEKYQPDIVIMGELSWYI